MRRRNPNVLNEMFVAREIVPLKAKEKANPNKLISSSDLRKVKNISTFKSLPSDGESISYGRGEILGFCEVTAKPFGMGPDDVVARSDFPVYGNDVIKRPVLSNLSVKRKGQKSGVGSALLKACEDAVSLWEGQPSYNEIVLQVEQDNTYARSFYERKGYDVVFADPSCRRFDTSGLWLRSIRTTKVSMRKKLSRMQAGGNVSNVVQNLWDSLFGELK